MDAHNLLVRLISEEIHTFQLDKHCCMYFPLEVDIPADCLTWGGFESGIQVIFAFPHFVHNCNQEDWLLEDSPDSSGLKSIFR